MTEILIFGPRDLTWTTSLIVFFLSGILTCNAQITWTEPEEAQVKVSDWGALSLP